MTELVVYDADRMITLGDIVFAWLFISTCHSIIMGLFLMFIGTITSLVVGGVSLYVAQKHTPLYQLPSRTWWQRWLLAPVVNALFFGLLFALVVGVGALAAMAAAPQVVDSAMEMCVQLK